LISLIFQPVARVIFQPQSRQRQKHSDNKAFFYSFTLFMSFVVTHLDNTTNKRKQGYPEVITCLPKADIQFEGVKAWILQADTRQLVFFEFEADAKVPEHSHDYAQWGMVIDGKMELTINEKPRICEKGDEYVIPVGAKHFARFLRRTRVMDLFSEKNRYKPKTIRQSTATSHPTSAIEY
jgi:mannose-6-phosphate isomerase-like protein (cupin superfamily)